MVESVLLPVDIEHSEVWQRVRNTLVRLFRDGAVELHVLYVVPRFEQAMVGTFFPDDFEEKAIAVAKTALAGMISGSDLGALGVPKLHVAHGKVYQEILAAADRLGVSLIVVGAHRPELSDYLLGANAAKVARHARQSVLVLR